MLVDETNPLSIVVRLRDSVPVPDDVLQHAQAEMTAIYA